MDGVGQAAVAIITRTGDERRGRCGARVRQRRVTLIATVGFAEDMRDVGYEFRKTRNVYGAATKSMPSEPKRKRQSRILVGLSMDGGRTGAYESCNMAVINL